MRNAPPAQEQAPPVTQSNAISPLDAIRLLRSAGGALFAQAGLHGQLARVEWAEEKIRLTKMLIATLAGFACLLCCLIFAGVLVLALTWETEYRIAAILALGIVYGIGALIAWLRLRALSALSEQAFAATREELAADIALIKSKL